MVDPLEDGGYPALYAAANEASLTGQRHYLRAHRIRLGSLLFATTGAAVFFALGLPQAAGWAALFGFVAAIAAELYSALFRPDRQWYEGRAAAESAKTLAWRYAVGGDKFPMSEVNVDENFTRELASVLKALREVDLSAGVGSGLQITPSMREIRSKTFPDRVAAYSDGRIENQRDWYTRNSSWNRKRLHSWTIFVVTIEALGVLGGTLVVACSLTVDLLGVLAAVAAVATAWVQAKQHGNLATAYGITAQELASIRSRIAAVKELDWPRFVDESEEAISREHTLWSASRGV